MIRYINISNDKNRDAEITFKSLNPKPAIKMALESGEKIINKKVVKTTPQTTTIKLLYNYESKNDDDKTELMSNFSSDLVNSDIEIDMELTGKFLEEVSRVYINEDEKPVFSVKKIEKIYSPSGELKEEREPKYNESNINDHNKVKWTGKMMPKNKVFNKLVFNKKYQLKHINGLTFDFLFDIAKKLNESNSLMMLGAGKSGKEPLVMNDGGKPYRAFLEGRIKEDKYCLILHLTDQELKPLPV